MLPSAHCLPLVRSVIHFVLTVSCALVLRLFFLFPFLVRVRNPIAVDPLSAFYPGSRLMPPELTSQSKYHISLRDLCAFDKSDNEPSVMTAKSQFVPSEAGLNNNDDEILPSRRSGSTVGAVGSIQVDSRDKDGPSNRNSPVEPQDPDVVCAPCYPYFMLSPQCVHIPVVTQVLMTVPYSLIGRETSFGARTPAQYEARAFRATNATARAPATSGGTGDACQQ